MTDVPQPGRRLTVSVLLLASMTIMANATIAPSLPGLKAHFADVPGIDTLAGLIVTLPSLSIMLSASLVGALADRVNRQMLLALAALAYAVGGTAGLWADTLPQLLAGRVVLGLGVAGTMTLSMAWAADLWQGEARARYMGLQGAAMSGGGIVVMLLGGALATLHWRGAFAVYALVLPIALLALSALAPHARAHAASRDARRAQQAAAPREAFPWRAFAVVAPLAFLFMVTFYVMPTRLPFLLAELGMTNTLVTGAIMASMTLASMPGALLYGQVRRFLSPMGIFAASYLLMGLGLLIISQAQSAGLIVLGSLVAGVGMGPSMPNYTTYFMGFVPASQRGRASGLLTTAFFAGQFASPLVSAPLVAAFGLRGAFEMMGFGLLALGAFLIVLRQVRGAAPVAEPR
ncbi:Predicted arabinose efflux permease, MFS family [Gemmobacter aquatilis]|uniref:Predicted arabinose efflux permease, MFS family n=1 Tax=Gemmobacter aquatilis TaxID=933059 RepID=A0A1H8BIT1_9RHOB|nr:MFS transporter [Gemmobacter aquatilis]SEM82765.1 Predicted arabinose efflux permease, MFS family [Gemmobacter aquatilis]